MAGSTASNRNSGYFGKLLEARHKNPQDYFLGSARKKPRVNPPLFGHREGLDFTNPQDRQTRRKDRAAAIKKTLIERSPVIIFLEAGHHFRNLFSAMPRIEAKFTAVNARLATDPTKHATSGSDEADPAYNPSLGTDSNAPYLGSEAGRSTPDMESGEPVETLPQHDPETDTWEAYGYAPKEFQFWLTGHAPTASDREDGFVTDKKTTEAARRRFFEALNLGSAAYFNKGGYITYQVVERNRYFQNNMLNTIAAQAVYRYEQIAALIRNPILADTQLAVYSAYGIIATLSINYAQFRDPFYTGLLQQLMFWAMVYDCFNDTILAVDSLIQVRKTRLAQDDPKYVGYEAYKPKMHLAYTRLALRSFTSGRSIVAMFMQDNFALHMMAGPISWIFLGAAHLAKVVIGFIDKHELNREVAFEQATQQDYAAVIAAIMNKSEAERTAADKAILDAKITAYLESCERVKQLEKERVMIWFGISFSTAIVIGAAASAALGAATGGLFLGALVIGIGVALIFKYALKAYRHRKTNHSFTPEEDKQHQVSEELTRVEKLTIRMAISQFESNELGGFRTTTPNGKSDLESAIQSAKQGIVVLTDTADFQGDVYRYKSLQKAQNKMLDAYLAFAIARDAKFEEDRYATEAHMRGLTYAQREAKDAKLAKSNAEFAKAKRKLEEAREKLTDTILATRDFSQYAAKVQGIQGFSLRKVVLSIRLACTSKKATETALGNHSVFKATDHRQKLTDTPFLNAFRESDDLPVQTANQHGKAPDSSFA